MGLEFFLGFVVFVSGVQQRFRWDAAHVQTGAAELAAFLDTRGFEPELGSFNSGHVATRSTANNSDIVSFGCEMAKISPGRDGAFVAAQHLLLDFINLTPITAVVIYLKMTTTDKYESLQVSLGSRSPESLTRPQQLRISIKPPRPKHQVYSAISIYDPESKKYQIRKTINEPEAVPPGITPPLSAFEARLPSPTDLDLHKVETLSSMSRPSPLMAQKTQTVVRNSGLDRKQRKPSELMTFMR